MHENKFENQVQEKMQELQFAPSDLVWENVDKQINKEKKRRWPLIWALFLLGFALLSGGYFYFANNKPSASIARVQKQKEIESQEAEQPLAKDKKEIEQNKKEYNEEKKSLEQKKTLPPIKFSGKDQENKEDEKTIDQYNQVQKNVLRDQRISGSMQGRKRKVRENTPKTNGVGNEPTKTPEKNVVEEKKNEPISDTNREDEQKNESSSAIKIAGDSAIVKKTTIPALSKRLVGDSASGIKPGEDKKQQRKSSPWKIGFTAAAGISTVDQSLFKSTYVTNPYYYTPTSTVSTPGMVINASSKIYSYFSFAAGAFVNRHLSKRISFSAGIDYHYFSTKIHTGIFVDSSRNVFAANASTTVARGYYRNGNSNEYINYYHFIELPLTMNFQLNKSQKVAFVWEGGLSLSYLISSDALHFDPVTDVYYKNDGFFNKAQLNAVTALKIGFHIHNSDLEIGPQFQYGFTRLLNKGTANPEHLFYSGLKASFMLRKK
ncbi:MAG TPA: outer membrane beta-barrel protein [Puia sp.]|jgi:hypothetical protein|nr:outer membrane beta-barrel protein [Puia sp.]